MTQFSSINAGIPAGPSINDGTFLTQWSGEVDTTFKKTTVTKGRFRSRTITNGRSYQYPAIGGLKAEYHTPGNVILGQDAVHGTKTVTVDDLLVSSVFIANIEEAMTHYPVRKEYTSEMGYVMAQTFDHQIFATLTKSAVDGETGILPGFGPATEQKIGTAPTLANIEAAIFDAAVYFDKTNIPQQDRVAFIDPETYWAFVEDGKYLNRDFGNTGNGNQETGGLRKIAGFELVVSNNLALNFGVDTMPGKRNGSNITDYTVDGLATKVLCTQGQALGTVTLIGMASESEYQMERQGYLMLSKYAVGHDILRPECIRLISAKV